MNPGYPGKRNPAQTHGSIPGATIAAGVGKQITAHFRNQNMRPGLSQAERILRGRFDGRRRERVPVKIVGQ